MLTAVRQLASADFIAMVTWDDADVVELTECDPAIVAPLAFRAPPSWADPARTVLFEAGAAARQLLPSVVLFALREAPGAACVVHGPREHDGRRHASLLVIWLSEANVPAAIRHNPAFLEHLLVGRTTTRRSAMPASEARLDAIMAHVSQGVVFVDHVHDDAIVNAAAARLLHLPVGVMTRRELRIAMLQFISRLRNAGVIEEECLRISDDPEAHIDDWTWELDDDSGEMIRVMSVPVAAVSGRGRLWTFDDVSLERALMRELAHHRVIESKLRQVQKMEVVGRLAAGIAHDFNNLLTIIGGSVEMLDDLALDDERRVDLHNIAQATERARRLTRQLLTFTRQQVERSESFAVDARLRETASLLNKVLSSGITLALDLRAEGAKIFADPGQIELALLNLLANARDAMPDGGVVTLHTSVELIAGERVLGSPNPLAGTHVAIAVQDSGTGFDESTRERMFEPFFTTKPAGHGTGLGLATVLAVAQQCGGGVRCSSTPGLGSTFTLLLPHTNASEPVDAPLRKSIAVGAPLVHVLLVDDDPGPRDAMRRLLVHEGFEVDVADSAAAALRLLAARGGSFDAIVTDYMMPQMSGRELLERVREGWPDLPAVVVSGFAPNEVTTQTLAGLHAGFLAKPFTGRELAARIREQIALALAGAVAPRATMHPD